MSLSAQWPRLAIAMMLALTLGASAQARSLQSRLAVERARPAAPLLPRDSFVVETAVSSVTLSPDGRRVVWLREDDGVRSLWAASTAGPTTPHRLLQRVEAKEVHWSSDSRWLLLLGARTVRAVAMAGQTGAGIIVTLGGPTKSSVLALDPWGPGVLLTDTVGAGLAKRWRLWRVGLGGARRLVLASPREIVDAVMARDGRLAFAKVTDGERHEILTGAPGGAFRPLARCDGLARCNLLGVAPDGRAVLVAGDFGEAPRPMLFRLDLDGRRSPVHADPRASVDLGSVVFDRRTGAPVIASYRGGDPRSYGLDAATRAALAKLERTNVDPGFALETSAGPWLVREREARLAGERWRLFDPRSGRLTPLIDDPGERRRPSPVQLARTIGVTFRASDGMDIHGFLTAPPGLDLKRTPLAAIVHGGPWSHDDPDYSAVTQLLANRGYVVFRPQFRGSTGYGRDYMLAANGDFADGRVQRDIEEGVRWLLAQGVGDPKRTAIVGASFGGYSVLQSLSNQSNLFGVGVAIVPPTDMGWVTRWAARTGALDTQGVKLETTLRLLKMDPGDAAVARKLYAGSPSARVAAMRTPLLIIASGRDERVPIRSVIDYAARLRVAAANARIVVARKLPHASSDPLAFRASLFMIETTLQRELGGAQPDRPASDLSLWMAQNLSITAPPARRLQPP